MCNAAPKWLKDTFAVNEIGSKILTTYRIRTSSLVDSVVDELRGWKAGVSVGGVNYGPVFVDVEKRTETQTWLKVRYVQTGARDVCDLFWYKSGIRVNRVNVYAFGPYKASDVPERTVLRIGIDDAIKHLVAKREIKPVLLGNPSSGS